MQKRERANVVMLRPLHFSGRGGKQQRLLYGGKDLRRYLLQSAAQIRANSIVRLGCALSLGHSGFENVQGWGLPPSLASGIAGPCETCEMVSTELFSRNMTRDERTKMLL